MARPYSEDLLEDCLGGGIWDAVARQFGVSISFVVKLMQRWHRQGTVKADGLGAGESLCWRVTRIVSGHWWLPTATSR